ncbi:hypothetical protein BB561_000428 [Smittium simulii]|uniref:Uncharacterized protein n=1 Tax=Smittium simulii TaxID=133385 RepID=A0A2T9YZ54_9FUNG|nr:hypothetical protein BB561_000428 [Smittium simulii]
MEYFRALSNTIAKPKKKAPALKQFEQFEKAWKDILSSEERTPDSVIIKTSIPQNIQILCDSLLQEEVRRKDSGDNTTGACMEFFLKNNLLGKLVQLAEPDLPRGFRCEVMRSISNLVNLLDESFLQHKNVHNPILHIFKRYSARPRVAIDYSEPSTMALKKTTTYHSPTHNNFNDPLLILSEKVGLSTVNSSFSIKRNKTSKLGMRGWAPATEVWQTTGHKRDVWEKSQFEYHEQDFVELMYIVSSKVHGYPYILSLFFYDKHWKSSLVSESSLDSQPTSIDNYLKSNSTTISKPASINSLNIKPTAEQSEIDTKTKNIPPSLSSNKTIHQSQYSLLQKNLFSTDLRFEFNLFANLLKYIYYDGKIGDYSRTAILFLLELAFPLPNPSNDNTFFNSHIHLETYIIQESGFASVICASLGAVYSQLPPRISLSRKKSPIVPLQESKISADIQNATELSFSNSPNSFKKKIHSHTVSTQSQEFINKINSFSQILNFIQDLYYRTPSPTIKESILQNFQDNFLATILYPSILESNDNDGSSVAVMIYLDKMLKVFNHPDLGSLILNFFNGEPDSTTEPSITPLNLSQINPSLSENNRVIQPIERRDSTFKFTLRDLICTNIQPNASSDSLIVALKLLKTILVHWCPYTINSLIEFEPVSFSNISHPWLANFSIAIIIHKRELEMYGELVMNLENGSKTKSHNRLGIKNNSFYNNCEVSDSNNSDSGANAVLSATNQIISPANSSDASNFELSNSSKLHFTPNSSNFNDQDVVSNNISTSKFNVPQNLSFYRGFDLYLNDASEKLLSHLKIHQNVTNCQSHSKKKISTLSAKNNIDIVNFNNNDTDASLNISTVESETDKTDIINNKSYDFYNPEENFMNYLATSEYSFSERMKIKNSDPLIRNLVNLLSRYFSLSSECNLALTGVIAALISCPLTTPDSWLTFDINSLLRETLKQPWERWVAVSEHKANSLSVLNGLNNFSNDKTYSTHTLKPDTTNITDGNFDINSETNKFTSDNSINQNLSDSSFSIRNSSTTETECSIDDFSKLKAQSAILAEKVKKDLAPIIQSDFHVNSLKKSRDSSNQTTVSFEANPSNNMIEGDEMMKKSFNDTKSSELEYTESDIDNFISSNPFPGFEDFKLDMNLEKSVAALPNGAAQPLLYAVLSSIVNQAASLIPYVPDYKKRLKRARNQLNQFESNKQNDLKKSENLRTNMNTNAETNTDSIQSKPLLAENLTINTVRDNSEISNDTFDDESKISSVINSLSSFVISSYSIQNYENKNIAENNEIKNSIGNPVVTSEDRSKSQETNATDGYANKKSNNDESDENSKPDKADSRITNDANSNQHRYDLQCSNSTITRSSSKKSTKLGSMPPPNTNMMELIENIIILQESIKEIVAYLQIRRENGYDDQSII